MASAPPLSQLYLFQEKRFSAFQHSLRIYVHGVDVSPWLKGEVTITYANRDSYNTLSFNLANPRGLWQLSEKNLSSAPGNFAGKGEFDESAKAEIFKYKNNMALNPPFSLDVKQAAFGTEQAGKVAKAGSSSVVQASSLVSENPFFQHNPMEEHKYRLAVNDCIFNKHDYVRVFMANPMAPIGDQWIEMFCGFIQEHPITTNYINGESTVRISASCIKQQLTKMRVQTNVHMAGIDPQKTFDEGFYTDFIRPSIMSHPFAQSSLEDTIKLLILGSMTPGDATQQEGAARSADSKQDLQKKVGDFKPGNIICYNPKSPGSTLECWHLMTIFGVNKVPFPKGGAEDPLWLTYKEMSTIGRATRPGQDHIVGSPIARYLHFLLPATGTGAGALIQYDFMQGGGAQARDWSNRWEIIRDFASKLDFQVLTSPSGDILVEFPQYGFTPCAYMNSFGRQSASPSVESTSAYAEAKKSQTNSLNSAHNAPKSSQKGFEFCENTLGSIASLFVFSRHEKEGTLNDEAEDFPTILTVSGGMAFTQAGAKAKTDVLNPRAYIYAQQLVNRYGIIAEAVDFPYAGQQPDDDSGESSAPLVRRIAQLGLIEYTKRMANASTWQGSLVFRPFLFPNRPIELRRSARIGNITSVTHTWNIGKDATTSVVTNQLMARRADGSYRLLTGSINAPIDYGAIWGGDEASGGKVTEEVVPQATDSGVRTGTGSGKQANQAAKNESATAAPGSATALLSSYSNRNLNSLFPPFRDLVERLITEANLKGLSPQITSTYRSSAKQQAIKNNPQKYPVSAEPYLSMHNYGLAVDIVISGVQGVSDKKLDALGQANKDAGTNLVWGGDFRTYDGVHFQVPAGWISVAKARAIVDLLVGQGKSEAEAIQQVWYAIYTLVPNLEKNTTGLVPPIENLNEVIANADPNAPVANLTVSDFGQISTPPVCADSKPLKDPGLKMKVG